MKKDSIQPELKLAGVCGLFCPGCLIYIAQRETPENREKIAASLGLPVEAMRCDGCRSKNRFAFCDGCEIAECAAEKEIRFCYKCKQFPCKELEKFQIEMPHRAEIWKNLKNINLNGYVKWFKEMLDYYACSKCNTLNSSYHTTCRFCKANPGNAFVEKHRSDIERFITTNMQSRQKAET